MTDLLCSDVGLICEMPSARNPDASLMRFFRITILTKEKARTLWSAPSIAIVAGGWGDQATIKAAWCSVAKATGAKSAKAMAMEKNLVIGRAPKRCFMVSGMLMHSI